MKVNARQVAKTPKKPKKEVKKQEEIILKTENLKEGMILKNYKELCSVLEIEPKSTGGNSKAAQFKELDKYCKYHKEGHKIIIDKIFNEVKDKVDKRTEGNNNELSRHIRYMLLCLANKNKLRDRDEIGFSKTFLYGHCGMINEINYKASKGNKKAFAEHLNLDELAIYECFDYTDERMYQALKRALSALQNNDKALIYRLGYNYVLEGQPYHYATDIDETLKIQEIENRVMGQMGYFNYEKIPQSGKWDEYKFRVLDTLRKEQPLHFGNVSYYYRSIVIGYKDVAIKRTKEKYEKKGYFIESSKEIVNQAFSKSLDGTITRRHKKYKDMDPSSLDKIDTYRASTTYVKEQKKAKNTIVNSKSKKVKYEATGLLDFDEQVQFEQININDLNNDIPF